MLSFLAFKTREGSGKSVNFVPYGMSDLIGGQSLINIELTDPSIFEALTFITEMNNWKFEVRSNAVIVMPIDYVAAEDLKVVTYPILPEVGAELECHHQIVLQTICLEIFHQMTMLVVQLTSKIILLSLVA